MIPEGAIIPVIAVLGRKKTGKTLVTESIIKVLDHEGYNVASGKHVAQKGFSLDQEKTDSYRHKMAGACKVIVASDSETTLLITEPLDSFHDLLRYSLGCDVLVLEGFSSIVLEDPHVAKIVCFKRLKEKKDFKSATPMIGYFSFSQNPPNSIEFQDLMKKVVEYVRRTKNKL